MIEYINYINERFKEIFKWNKKIYDNGEKKVVFEINDTDSFSVVGSISWNVIFLEFSNGGDGYLFGVNEMSKEEMFEEMLSEIEECI